jgi:RNA-directed DNA polymerase
MNMTLDGLEDLLRARYRSDNNNPSRVNIVRYADDFIITGATQEVLAETVNELMTDLHASVDHSV